MVIRNEADGDRDRADDGQLATRQTARTPGENWRWARRGEREEEGRHGDGNDSHLGLGCSAPWRTLGGPWGKDVKKTFRGPCGRWVGHVYTTSTVYRRSKWSIQSIQNTEYTLSCHSISQLPQRKFSSCTQSQMEGLWTSSTRVTSAALGKQWSHVTCLCNGTIICQSTEYYYTTPYSHRVDWR